MKRTPIDEVRALLRELCAQELADPDPEAPVRLALLRDVLAALEGDAAFLRARVKPTY